MIDSLLTVVENLFNLNELNSSKINKEDNPTRRLKYYAFEFIIFMLLLMVILGGLGLVFYKIIKV